MAESGKLDKSNDKLGKLDELKDELGVFVKL